MIDESYSDVIIMTRVVDRGGVNPDPTLQKNPDMDPTDRSYLIQFILIFFDVKVDELEILMLYYNFLK